MENLSQNFIHTNLVMVLPNKLNLNTEKDIKETRFF